jgi:hypothetical protein
VTATLSKDGRYRYDLHRGDPRGRNVLFTMLNPSVADADQDDPTIRKCRGFCERWSFDGFWVANLFAYRATDPRDLWRAERDGIDIVGPLNNEYIGLCALRCEEHVAAWGAQADNPAGR